MCPRVQCYYYYYYYYNYYGIVDVEIIFHDRIFFIQKGKNI